MANARRARASNSAAGITAAPAISPRRDGDQRRDGDSDTSRRVRTGPFPLRLARRFI